ncbi:PREDICTED: beta-amylase 1, chloroplastic-like isoform X2 [Ipomoea nil]|uniref:beta-amylase 1, chloroplastic-like isoform X2 n=1 Tax=Ipomoea nil TaxID=35883 RepID=UPI000900EAC5|nr:PREDICTED: beta-amylase 1, chloroplastic-like isoform X2 [Ipomoea nil]
MAIASPSAPRFSSFCCCRVGSARAAGSVGTVGLLPPIHTRFPARKLTLYSRLDSSSSASSNDPDGELRYELQHGVPTHPHPHRRGTPVFVTLPVDAVSSPSGQMTRKKIMKHSFTALKTMGVEGVVMEVWWGLVERESPRVYNWQGYLEIVALAKRIGLKVRAVMAFHQCGTGTNDPFWVPLPKWVLEEMEKDPDLAYSDRFGRRSLEYISLGCDVLPILHGRSPVQAYTDFMKDFKEIFKAFLGTTITGIQVGMGPGGELRYPSCPPKKLTSAWRSRELGEFQCYDRYMLASQNACAGEVGMREWANGGPIGASSLMHDPESTEFFRSDGSWNTAYGDFFLQWYSGMLLLHGERICKEAESIFRGFEVDLSGKVAGIHWHYGTPSHPSELTAGYYNTSIRDGYLPIARMFGRYRFTICCPCFEMKDAHEQKINPVSSPEGLLRQLLLAARFCYLPLVGENSATSLDDQSFEQVLKMSKFYSDGLETPYFSFNFVRMDKHFFDTRNIASFTRFVKQMSDTNNIRAKLSFGDGDMRVSSSSSGAAANMKAVFA